MARLPNSHRWNRVPSSLVNTSTSTGCRRDTLASDRAVTTSMPPITPRAPSYFPPLGTVSMCDPMAIAGRFGSDPSLRAMMFPPGSIRTSIPARRIRDMV